MPTVASRGIPVPDVLLDTSAAVPLVVADHEHHRAVVEAVSRLIGHFPATRLLSGRAAAKLLASLGALAVAGGAVYDALLGAAAVEHRLTLMTRDRRAAETYRRLDVRFLLVD